MAFGDCRMKIADLPRRQAGAYAALFFLVNHIVVLFHKPGPGRPAAGTTCLRQANVFF